MTASFGTATQIYFEDFEGLTVSEDQFGYYDDETFIPTWFAQSAWTLADGNNGNCPPPPNNTTVAYFGNTLNCNYVETGDGSLEMLDSILLPDSGDVSLSFASYEDLYCASGGEEANLNHLKSPGLASPLLQGECTVYDHLLVEVGTFDGEGWSWNLLAEMDNNGGGWYTKTLSLADYLGQEVKLRFHFDVGNDGGDNLGWMIDDVAITELLSTPITSGVSYTWNFGDGGPILPGGSVITHTYETAGVFTAVVNAANGVSVVTAATTVTVIAPPAGLTAFNDGPRVGSIHYSDGYCRAGEQCGLHLGFW